MALAHSKVTAQGQISVPSDVRRKLGVGPGSMLEWEELDQNVIVRRAGRFSSADIHAALFGPQSPKPRTTEDLKEGIRELIRKRHAGR